MKKDVDIIKGLALKIEQNLCSKNRDQKKEQQLLRRLGNSFNSLILEPDDQVFSEDFLSVISSPMSNKYISQNYFPCNYDEYGAYRAMTRFTNDLKYELRWLVFSLKFYAEAISIFVSAREKYDNCILLNKYDEALGIVDEMEKKFGVSLWSSECRFFLYSKMNIDIKKVCADAEHSNLAWIFEFYEFKNRENVTEGEYYYIAQKEIRTVQQHITKDASLIVFFKYIIEGIDYQGNPTEILNIIEWMRLGTLIDQYLFFIDVCDYTISLEKDHEISVIIRKYIHELSDIADEHLISLRFVFDGADNRKNNYELKSKLECVKEEFIKGNLALAKKKAIELLMMYPNNMEAVSLLVDINILTGDDSEDFGDKNLEFLTKKLKAVYSLDKKRDDEIEAIYKFANCNSWSSWSKCLRNNIIYRCQEYGEANLSCIAASVQYLDIETVIATLQGDELIAFISEKMDVSNQYILFRKACCEKKIDLAMSLCGLEQIRDSLFVWDERNDISEKIGRLGVIKGKDAAMAIMRIRHFLWSINVKENYDIVLSLSAKLVVENIFTAVFLPFERLVNFIDDSSSEVRKKIYTPILYYVYARYVNKEKMDDLGIVCEDFFLYNDIVRPSKMDIYAYGSKEISIFFLKNVCTAKVLDVAVMDLKNSEDRENERVAICNVLNEIDPCNKSEYDKEITEITQRLMINKEHCAIEANKIHVNVDGIKEKLINNYKNEYSRYKFYKDRIFDKWPEIFTEDSIQQLKRDSKRILLELVYKIRDAFVSSEEYGLDFYLSLNIRHGLLAEELRGPLYKTMLTAKKDVDTGKYSIYANWLRNVDSVDQGVITMAITEFYCETEAIISKLRDKYIQIGTEEKYGEGVFQYVLSQWDLDDLYSIVELKDTFEEVLDAVIAYMWRITEVNLETIKYTIKCEIQEDYNKAFNALKLKVSKLKNKDRTRELLQEINKAATDMPNVLDKICHWFQRSTNSQHNDFDLQLAYDTGLQTIANIHREREFVSIAKEEPQGEKVPGCYMNDYVGIFSILFGNIAKYANEKMNRRTEIRYKLKYIEGETYIYIENDFDCTRDISSIISRIDEQKEAIRTGDYKKRIKGEGGTGLLKICNIVSSNIRKELQIDYGFVLQENIFYVELKF